MSTSFFVTRDQVILAALQKCGAVGKTETPDDEDFDICGFALNIIIKAWIKGGCPMWKILDIPVPLVINQEVYQIGPAVVGTGAVQTDKPLRIFDGCFMRDGSGKDTPLNILAKNQYNALGDKSQHTGNPPTSIYYTPGAQDGTLYVYPSPGIDTAAVHLIAQVPISDAINPTDVMDFPSECYQALVWGLSDEISETYRCSDARIARIERKAKIYKDEMENWSVEEESLYLQFDNRGR